MNEKQPTKVGLHLADFEDVKDGATTIKCKRCGAEYEIWSCNCGKFGTEEMMRKHVEERHSKRTKEALEAHSLVPPYGNPLPPATDEEVKEHEKKPSIFKRKA
jgi:ribosomal protein L37E